MTAPWIIFLITFVAASCDPTVSVKAAVGVSALNALCIAFIAARESASTDTHRNGGDAKQAPALLSGAVPKADAQ